MKFLMGFMLLVSICSVSVAAPPKAVSSWKGNGKGTAKTFYGANGRYEGRISESGSIYGTNNRYQGRISNNGNVYGSSGQYKGRISTKR